MATLDESLAYFRRSPTGWMATQALLAAWKAAGAARGILPALTLAEPSRRPTGPFLGLWRMAFPGVLAPRAGETLCEANGKGAAELFRAWRRLP